MSIPNSEGGAPARPGEPGRRVEEFLDTNPVIRYLIRDDRDLAARATALIESERQLSISIVTLAEIGYVLAITYAGNHKGCQLLQ